MTCQELEPRIALWAGGDLPVDEAVELEAHLAQCEVCRAAALELRQCCEALAELRDVPAMTVRAAVMERIAHRRRKWWSWWWIPATASLAASTLWLVSLDTRIPPSPPAPLVRAAAPAQALEFTAKVSPRPRLRHKARPRARESTIVKIITDDPDVVIYWLMEKDGD